MARRFLAILGACSGIFLTACSALLRPVEKFDHRADMALNFAIFIMTARHQ
jgi:hypothetical protein